MNRKGRRRRRIAVILANLHTGAAGTMWPPLVEEAARHGFDLYLIPGGRLRERADQEYLRNHVFDLVDAHGFDGLISWASAIGSSVSEQEIRSYHTRFAGIPAVSINQAIGTWPLFTIDAYAGMRELAHHLVDVHDHRRIAFVRGPASTPSAEERLAGFYDALGERGIPVEARLVSSPHGWTAGAAAARELLDERGLQPGRDFDAIIAASDMQLLEVVRLLQARGFAIPGDVAVAGFNDSAESRVTSPSFTTVRMPFDELGRSALRSLHELMDGLPSPSKVVLRPKLVVRQSCGCTLPALALMRTPVDRSADDDGGAFESQRVVDNIAARLEIDDEDRVAWVEPLVAAFMESIEREQTEPFTTTVQRVLSRVMIMHREIEPWREAIGILRARALGSGADPRFVENLFGQAWLLTSEVVHQAHSYREWDDAQIATALAAFDRTVLLMRDVDSIAAVLARLLPGIGVHEARMIAYEARGDQTTGRIVGGFQIDAVGTIRRVEPAPDAEPAPVHLLLSERDSPGRGPASFVVEPLAVDETPYGFVTIRTGPLDGVVYEHLGRTIASALKAVTLFDEATRARMIAERAETAKSRFLANMSGELEEPLQAILQAGLPIERAILADATPDPASVNAWARIVMRTVRRQAQSSRDLLDLALADVDELALTPRLVDAGRLFDEAIESYRANRETDVKLCAERRAELPLLFADPQRIARVIQILLDQLQIGAPLQIDVTTRVLVPHVELELRARGSSRAGGDEAVAGALARMISVLHGGTVGPDEPGTRTLRLPLPNAPGKLVAPGPHEHATIFSLTDAVPAGLACGPAEIVGAEALVEHGGSFASWRPALLVRTTEAHIADVVTLRTLSRSAGFDALPLLLYGEPPDEPKTPGEYLASLAEAAAASPLLVLDEDRDRRDRLVAEISAAPNASRRETIGLPVASIGVLYPDLRPAAILMNDLNPTIVRVVRSVDPGVPILVLADRIASYEAIAWCGEIDRLVVVNRGVFSPAELGTRLCELASSRRGSASRNRTTAKRAVAYINASVSQPISRWQMSEAANVSEDYLSRVFNREIGLSPWEYLRRYRIALAKERLLADGESVREIAQAVGFTDHTYFCRVFREIAGLTPTTYRNTTVVT